MGPFSGFWSFFARGFLDLEGLLREASMLVHGLFTLLWHLASTKHTARSINALSCFQCSSGPRGPSVSLWTLASEFQILHESIIGVSPATDKPKPVSSILFGPVQQCQ